MISNDLFAILTIYLLIPLAGLLWFLKLRRQMLNRKVANSLNPELLFAFANYGGLLLVGLTSLFGEWSGMASFGTFYLILVAPIGMGFISLQNRKTRNDSKYQKAAFWSSATLAATASGSLKKYQGLPFSGLAAASLASLIKSHLHTCGTQILPGTAEPCKICQIFTYSLSHVTFTSPDP